jgi:Protein of unknown function (DUF433)
MIMYEVLSNRVMGAVIYSSREMHGDGMESVIVKNPKILCGTPAFRGTRLPLQLLFDSLEQGTLSKSFWRDIPPFRVRWQSLRSKKHNSSYPPRPECGFYLTSV